ncbi:MAG: sigma-70 family RNA polymerase sigma factor [Solirubrobacteraceae bacterium]
MTESADRGLGGNRLARAQRGDENAFAELTEPYRHELQLHCYRILGLLQDAEDLLQETLLAAWRGLEQFEGRSSLRAWLYTIATNRCLNALRDRERRPQAAAVPAASGGVSRAPGNFAEIPWLEPYPDLLLEGIADLDPGPEARYEAKEAVALAFVSGLQHLAPRQRAVLVLRDVLGFQAGEVAEMLGASEASVNSALQRARAALDVRSQPGSLERLSVPQSGAERDLIGRFAEALQNDDIDEVVALLTDDAIVSMPPQPEWHQGHEAVGAFLRDRARHRFGDWRLLETRANGQPALAYYLSGEGGGWSRAGLFVLELRRDRIASVTRFRDDGLLSRFGVPARLD